MHRTTLVIVITFSFWVRVTLVVVEVLEEQSLEILQVNLKLLESTIEHLQMQKLLVILTAWQR